MIGCGSSRIKFVSLKGRKEWANVTTLDINRDHRPDVVWDLHNMPLPFVDNTFDEIHAYEVLKHTAKQGDYKFFFAQFSEFWRILKPKGVFIGTCPMPNSPWAFEILRMRGWYRKKVSFFWIRNKYNRQIGKTAM